ncbi:MAG: GatB/YqeY domain-containing protein [Patescibacteria group bacterium]
MQEVLKQTISDDLKNALKSGDSFKVGILRLLLSALHNKEIEKRGKGEKSELSEEEIIEVLMKESKKRKEAIEIYSKGGRQDLAAQEAKESEIIKIYLPEQLSEAEVEKMALKAIEKIGAKNQKDFGKAMAEAMKELKGKTDASKVSEIIKKKLNS